MTIIKIESSNESILIWPDEDSQSQAATVTFYQGIFALLLRVGFIFIQIGCIPSENIYLIIMQNVLDIFVCLLSFGLLGFMLAYGKNSFWGVFGYGSWISSETTLLNEGVRGKEIKQMENFSHTCVVGFAATLTGSAVMTTLLASRLHYVGQVMISLAFSGIVLPILLHSSSIYNGWMMENRLDYVDVSFKDTGMVLVTSIAGSTAGMIGCAFLRRRMLRVRDIDPSSIGPTSPGTTVCGYCLILLGFAMLALPSPVMEEMQPSVDYDIVLIINGIISMSIGTSTVITLHLLFYQNKITYWVILKFLQGGLASFITISAAYDVYNTPISIIVALIGAIFFFFIAEYVFTTAIEDNCNIIAIHFTCGILSCLLSPFFSCRDNLGFLENPSAYMNMIHLAWQVLCCLIAIAAVSIVFCLIFLFLLVTGLLRNKGEKIAHLRAKRVVKGGAKIITAEPSNATDFISPNVEYQEFDDVEMKDNVAYKSSPNQDIFESAPNTTELAIGAPHSTREIFKRKESLNDHQDVRKGRDITKPKLRKHLQKCKNIVVKNPLHRDMY